MEKLSQPVLDTIKENIIDNLKMILGEKIHTIILYGSYARGQAQGDSDIDIFVIGDINDNELYSYRKAVCKVTSALGLKYDTIISVKMENKERFDDLYPILPFFQNVINDGVVLYVN